MIATLTFTCTLPELLGGLGLAVYIGVIIGFIIGVVTASEKVS